MSTSGRRASVVPDLFHVKRTLIDYSHDPSGTSIKTEVCATYTDLDAATADARRRLFDEGDSRNSFVKCEENILVQGHWKYPPEVLVHAETAEGDVVELVLETTPNMLGLKAKPNGRVEEDLFYVLQTKIYYNKDPAGKARTTDIKGAYLSRQAARTAARRLLLDYHGSKSWYSKYEEVTNLKEDEEGAEDAIVRAVGPEGVQYLVFVVHES
jgi:hypothetical protein